MFSGIVEAVGRVKNVRPLPRAYQVDIERPKFFDDLKTGDSIAVDGVCLTVGSFNDSHMTFTIAAETINVTGWNEERLSEAKFNLERSLRLGDRIHGHLVAGHVDGVGEVVKKIEEGSSLWYWIKFPQNLNSLLWKKGSVSLKGVSLTINDVRENELSVCLIPETLKRTNLGELQVGDRLNLEVDSLARAMINYLKTEGSKTWS